LKEVVEGDKDVVNYEKQGACANGGDGSRFRNPQSPNSGS